MQTLLPCPHSLRVQSAFSADPLTVPRVQSAFSADPLTVPRVQSTVSADSLTVSAQSPCAVNCQCRLSYRVRTVPVCSQLSVHSLTVSAQSPCAVNCQCRLTYRVRTVPVCSQLSVQTLLPCPHSPHVQSAFSADSLTVSAQSPCAVSFQCRLSYRVRTVPVCSQLSVQTLLPCPHSPRVQLHGSTFVLTLKIPNTCRYYTIVWTHLPYKHTDRNGYKRFSSGRCAYTQLTRP